MRRPATVLVLVLLVGIVSTAGAFGFRDRRTPGSSDRSSDRRRDLSRRGSTQTDTGRRGSRDIRRVGSRSAPRDPSSKPVPPPSTPPPAPTPGFGAPLRGLTPEQAQRFTDGRTAFEQEEEAADGLGPVFNDTSCVACHSQGATGGGSERVETRFGTTIRKRFDPLAGLGGSLIQTDGIGPAGACNFVGEVVPPAATIVAGRRATPIFGLGLVDAVPGDALVALAREQAQRHPDTAGRAPTVADATTGGTGVGRFGWKAQVASLFHFSGDAYLNEMGITTPFFPDENCPQGDCALLACDPVPGVDDDNEDVELFRDFMRFLSPPSRAGSRFRASRLFAQVGCADCHVPTMKSGASDVAALGGRTFQPYSDFLLHDMGDLGDGIEQADASGREMRTAPLWGIRVVTRFLHDGRALSIEDAILAHDGQGRDARNRFAQLPGDAKAKLLAYVQGL